MLGLQLEIHKYFHQEALIPVVKVGVGVGEPTVVPSRGLIPVLNDGY